MKKITSITRRKLLITLLCSGMALFVAPQVFADRFDDQIGSIQAEINNFQQQANEIRARGDTLQNALDVITAEKNALQAQIDLNQTKFDQLSADIKSNEEKLERQKRTLNKTVARIYANGDTTPIVMLASSKNVGEYVSAQAVRGTVRDQMKAAMDGVKKIKTELSKQKIDIERVLNDQTRQREALAAKESEQANLVAQTRGEEAAYQNLVSAKSAEIQNLRAQQAASYQQYGTASSSPTGLAISYTNMQVMGCGASGYSYCNYGWDDIVSDPWGLGYTKECVHYVADALTRRGYYIPYGLFAGRGNANQWIGTTSGGVAYTDSTPTVNSVVYMPIGGVGHVGMVEEVYGNGYIKVSQMNLPFGGHYSTMDLRVTSNLSFMHFSR